MSGFTRGATLASVSALTIAACAVIFGYQPGWLQRAPVSVVAKPRSSDGNGVPQEGREISSATATLYCEFYDMMHTSTVVSFDFRVSEPRTNHPSYTELSFADADGERARYEINQPAPLWFFSIDDGTPVIESEAVGVQIKLYGLKPMSAGILWIEAGIRSNTYKNLEGRCRQSHFDL